MKLSDLSCRFERFGFALPSLLQKPVIYLWHPLLFDWLVTVFTVGYALILLIMGEKALHLGVYKGPVVESFAGLTIPFAATLLLAGLVGMYGLAKRNKTMRRHSSYVLVLGYVFVAFYYFNAVPLPAQAVFIYGSHGLMEFIVYLRTVTDTRHVWERDGRG